ncbi:MAG: hypothetical protein OCD01_13960 [Fibrobacterales bacterium]
MNKSIRTFFLLFALYFLGACSTQKEFVSVNTSPTPPLENYLIANVTIIPMTHDTLLPHHSMWVTNGIIEKIAPYDSLLKDTTRTTINGEGKFLIPGFADMHVHTDSDEDLILFLANGVTTIRIMHGNSSMIERKERVINRTLIGPRVILLILLKKLNQQSPYLKTKDMT